MGALKTVLVRRGVLELKLHEAPIANSSQVDRVQIRVDCVLAGGVLRLQPNPKVAAFLGVAFETCTDSKHVHRWHQSSLDGWCRCTFSRGGSRTIVFPKSQKVWSTIVEIQHSALKCRKVLYKVLYKMPDWTSIGKVLIWETMPSINVKVEPGDNELLVAHIKNPIVPSCWRESVHTWLANYNSNHQFVRSGKNYGIG